MARTYPGIPVQKIRDKSTRNALQTIDIFLRQLVGLPTVATTIGGGDSGMAIPGIHDGDAVNAMTEAYPAIGVTAIPGTARIIRVNSAGQAIVDTELPAPAALTVDALSPVVPSVGAFAYGYNGATWDRIRASIANGILVDLGANNDVTVTGTVAISGSVTVVATNLDIRDLSSVSDSVTVVATNLDIRDLTHAADSVRIGDGTDLALVTAAGELNVLATAQPGTDIGDVTINNGAAGAAVNIQDGGNAITVDAVDLDIRNLGFATDSITIGAALPAGSNNIGDVDILSLPNEGQQTMANSISVAIATDQSAVPISAASLPLPTGAATSANQTTIITSLGTLATEATLTSVISTDDTTLHTTAVTKVLNLGAVATPTDTAVAANEIGMVAMSLDRRQFVDANVQQGDADVAAGNPLQVTVANTGANATAIKVNVISGGIASGAIASGAIASGALASGSVASGAVASGAIASGAVASGAVASGAFASGSIAAGAIAAGATSLVHLEDDPSANLDAGVGILAVRKATPANTSGTDGDYEFVQMSAGRVWTSATIDAAIPAGTNNIGDVDILSIVPGTGPTNLGKAEDATHTSADVGVMALAIRNDTRGAAGGIAGADLEYGGLQLNALGDLRVQVHAKDQNATTTSQVSSELANSNTVDHTSDRGEHVSDIVKYVVVTPTNINTTYDDSPTSAVSAEIDCRRFRTGMFSASITQALAPTDIRFEILFSDVSGGTFYKLSSGFWADNRLDDVVVTGGINRCWEFPAIGNYMEVQIVCTGTTATKTFTVTNARVVLKN